MISEQLDTYLRGWFAKSRDYQLKEGRLFELTYEDFIELWGTRRLLTMEQHLSNGSVYNRMNAANLFGYVLTWKSYSAAQTGVMTKENAQVCIRSKSIADNKMKKGDKHKPSARAKISAAKQGKTHSASHKQNISASLTGVKKGPMSAEHKANLSAAMKASRAARKAAQLGGQL